MGCPRISTPAHVPGQQASVSSADGDGRTPLIEVLVIDDDSRVRTALGQTIALETDMVMVAAVADTGAALAWAEHADPFIALVDVFLPDRTTGLALIGRLARRPGCAVVAMSLRGGLRPDALAAGAASFAEKGGDIDAILAAVRAVASLDPRLNASAPRSGDLWTPRRDAVET
jgi:DNA-binding NarL/FixJ family response regulator